MPNATHVTKTETMRLAMRIPMRARERTVHPVPAWVKDAAHTPRRAARVKWRVA